MAGVTPELAGDGRGVLSGRCEVEAPAGRRSRPGLGAGERPASLHRGGKSLPRERRGAGRVFMPHPPRIRAQAVPQRRDMTGWSPISRGPPGRPVTEPDQARAMNARTAADLDGHAPLGAHTLSHADPVDLARRELACCAGACRICPWPASVRRVRRAGLPGEPSAVSRAALLGEYGDFEIACRIFSHRGHRQEGRIAVVTCDWVG
jgi:hypothetical protein